MNTLSQDTSSKDFDPKKYLEQLTTRPGVYRMYDQTGRVIYVGKARNLQRRVSSYFVKNQSSAKTVAMVEHIARIEVTITDTEDEALILESTLIKDLKPRYNIVLRDDKSYPYLLITGDHDFPRIMMHRGPQKRKGHYFGPFPSVQAVRETQDTIQRLFKLRSCTDRFFETTKRPCLQYQIKRCSAPCVGYISKKDYAKDVADAIELLKGGNEKLSKRLVKEMQVASEALDFEQAAYLRNKISALRRLQAQAQTVGGRGDFDIICAAISGGAAVVVVVSIRGGNNFGHRSFYPRVLADTTVDEMTAAFLSQYYLERKPPPEVLLDPQPEDSQWLTESLSRLAGRKVALKHNVRGKRAQWLDNTRATLEQTISAYLVTRAGVEQRLNSLAKELGLAAPPMRISCFDISHLQGEATVASCVVFEAGVAKKSDYRRFNIKNVTAGDDYAAIEQALNRRFKRIKAGEAPLPDLVIIDGGKGQVKVAAQVLEQLELGHIQLIGVAQGPRKKMGMDQIFLPGWSKPLILSSDSPALHLIAQIRDEAHRFAITAHRGQRKKARRGSILDEVNGLGAKRKKALLQNFGGPRQIARASVTELAKVNGISENLAQRIYDHFH